MPLEIDQVNGACACDGERCEYVPVVSRWPTFCVMLGTEPP